MIPLRAINLQLDASIAFSRSTARTAQHQEQAVDALHALSVPMVCHIKDESVGFASRLAQHPPIGVGHMLALARGRNTRVRTGDNLTTLHCSSSRCEARLQLALQRTTAFNAPMSHSLLLATTSGQ